MCVHCALPEPARLIPSKSSPQHGSPRTAPCATAPGGLAQLPAGFRAALTCPFVSLSVPLIWGSVVLLGLLVVAVALFDVMARRKGR